MPRKVFPFLMGSDPEFSVLFQNKRVHADQLMRKVCKNVEWKDMGWTVEGMKGEIGWDGCAATGEIRPNPSDTVDGCIENMHSILTETYKRLSSFGLSTISTHAPVGGHIHLDFPDTWGDEKLKHAVHKLLSFYLPITLNENPISRAIRRQSYGKIDDYKVMAHPNGHKSVEIRCPSAEWITTPEVMSATLAYVGTVWNEILNHGAKFKKFDKIMMKNSGQLNAMQDMAISNHPLMIEMLFKQIKHTVRSFEFYPEYKKEIELMLNPKKIISMKTENGFDLFLGWKLKKNPKRLSKTSFLSANLLNAEMKKKNLNGDVANQIALPYNNDKNVNAFAAALESRMLALGWNPKFRYYLFGSKRGIMTPFAGTSDGKLAIGHELAKNEDDKSALVNTIQRMTSKAMHEWSSDTRVDPVRGIVFDTRPIVAFGIPFDWRGERITKINTVLNHIWNIEHKGSFTELTVPVGKEVVGGETAAAINEANETLNIDELVDRESQGHSFARHAVSELNRQFGNSLSERQEEAPVLIDAASITAANFNLTPGLRFI